MNESRHFTYKYSNDLPIYTSEKFIKLFSFYLFIYSIPKNKASQTAAEHWSQAVENGMMSAVLCKCDAENSIISHTNLVGKTLGGIRLFCSFEQTKQLTPIQNKKKSSSIHPHPNTNTHTITSFLTWNANNQQDDELSWWRQFQRRTRQWRQWRVETDYIAREHRDFYFLRFSLISFAHATTCIFVHLH